jgi:hypothetical protein
VVSRSFMRFNDPTSESCKPVILLIDLRYE